MGTVRTSVWTRRKDTIATANQDTNWLGITLAEVRLRLYDPPLLYDRPVAILHDRPVEILYNTSLFLIVTSHIFLRNFVSHFFG